MAEDKKESVKGYIVTDQRGMEEGQEHPEEVCRVCSSKTVHSKKYGVPTMECIDFLTGKIAALEQLVLHNAEESDE